MSFAISDFKKTSRTTELGRQVYPYQIRDDRYLASIGYAISYFDQMVGRQRSEFETNTLLEFFGEPKLARGLVACLGRVYRWHQRSLREMVNAETWRTLQAQNLTTAADLRAMLYRYVNEHHNGFILPSERRDVIETICHDLPITPVQFEQLLHLDDESMAILTRVGDVPDASEMVALYNFHSLETALRYSRSLTVRFGGDVWRLLLSVRNLARRYNLRYDISEPNTLFSPHVVVTWHGMKDRLGNWSRTGRKIMRCLLRLMAAHPDAALEGTAQITISGKTGNVKLTKRELQVLGAQRSAFADADDVWETTLDVALATAWSREQAKGHTAGWRLRRDPEPLTVGKQLLVPDFVLMRGSQRLPLFVPVTAASAESLLGTLTSTEHAVILLNTELGMTKRAASNVVSYQTMPDVSALVRYLQANFAENAVTTALDRWTQLTNVLDSEGFVPEAQLFTLLGCDNATTAVAMLRGWRDGAFHYVPHVGLCTPQKLGEIGELMRRAA